MSLPDVAGASAAVASAAIPEVFIYYRVRASDEAATRLRVAEFQSALVGRFGGLCARLLRRHPEAAEATADADAEPSTLVTLMEAYSFDAAAASQRRIGLAELLDAIGQAAGSIEPLIQGDRHVEVFEPCA